ncbi:MAG: hypothetical protein K1X75_10495 [Leptospirales bacterium]|nr:hypothetical protein [Leptospirales bacterium]
MKLFQFASRRSLLAAAAAIIVVAGSGLLARTVYVVSPAARLLDQPSMGSAGAPLQRGQPLNEQGEQGAFYVIKVGSSTKYVSKLFVSPFPPQQNQVSVADLQRNPNVNLNRQASQVSETAAARGLSAGGGDEGPDVPPQYNERQVRWLESQKVSRPEVSGFLRAGRLNAL